MFKIPPSESFTVDVSHDYGDEADLASAYGRVAESCEENGFCILKFPFTPAQNVDLYVAAAQDSDSWDKEARLKLGLIASRIASVPAVKENTRLMTESTDIDALAKATYQPDDVINLSAAPGRQEGVNLFMLTGGRMELIIGKWPRKMITPMATHEMLVIPKDTRRLRTGKNPRILGVFLELGGVDNELVSGFYR